jgi:hypothetical protein
MNFSSIFLIKTHVFDIFFIVPLLSKTHLRLESSDKEIVNCQQLLQLRNQFGEGVNGLVLDVLLHVVQAFLMG